MEFSHEPVLLAPIVAAAERLQPARVVDCTLGGGGHAGAVLMAAPGAQMLGIDRDPNALAAAKAHLGSLQVADRLSVANRPFGELDGALADRGWGNIDLLVADLGVSSHQLDTAERGFSFLRPGPLDMRMGDGPSLMDKLADIEADALADIVWRYGEERKSRRVARAILQWFEDLPSKAANDAHTVALADVVARAIGGRRKPGHHPATRTFQALRIWVNDEMGQLERLLALLPKVLAPKGEAWIIAFHSLEDRAVKTAFRQGCQTCVCPPELPVCMCDTKPVFGAVERGIWKASQEEQTANPRARSARLRAVHRLGATMFKMDDAAACVSGKTPDSCGDLERRNG